jgi:hypothetical protein
MKVKPILSIFISLAILILWVVAPVCIECILALDCPRAKLLCYDGILP